MRAYKPTSVKTSSVVTNAEWRDTLINLLYSCLCKTAFVYSSGSQMGYSRGFHPGDTWQSINTALVIITGKGFYWHPVQRPEMLLNILHAQGRSHRKGSSSPNANSAKVEKPWSTASLLLHTYHLIHGVTGVVVFWVGTPNPHRLEKFFLVLLIFVRQRLLRLFFLDWGIILLFAGALVVTPSVFFFLPTGSLLLSTWGATSKGGEGG